MKIGLKHFTLSFQTKNYRCRCPESSNLIRIKTSEKMEDIKPNLYHIRLKQVVLIQCFIELKLNKQVLHNAA